MIHFLRVDFGHSCNFLQYFKKDKLTHFPFSAEAALVSSRAFIIPSHNKKNIRLLSLFLVIFRPQCNAIVGVNMYAIRN